jgi:hypothetical protein
LNSAPRSDIRAVDSGRGNWALRGAAPRPQSFRFESVEDRNLAPVLISIATLNCLLESGGSEHPMALLKRAGGKVSCTEDPAKAAKGVAVEEEEQV